ncbi:MULTISPECIES: hypothetical protein [Methylobacterium]|jgi:hypothetical protein|uniref:hypothetical protein n=1 Tax=Methylobacterium TaxID=407 RepID=UPI0012E6F2A1|nr:MULTISPECIES: hypothetical protein [unclassified Methylobacterium]
MSSNRPLPGSVEAKIRRAPKVNISNLNDEQRILREHVLSLGKQAFGERWLSPMAAALSKETGRRISVSQVAQWQSGERPVPIVLVPSLNVIAHDAVRHLLHRADEIKTRWLDANDWDISLDMKPLVVHLQNKGGK